MRIVIALWPNFLYFLGVLALVVLAVLTTLRRRRLVSAARATPAAEIQDLTAHQLVWRSAGCLDAFPDLLRRARSIRRIEIADYTLLAVILLAFAAHMAFSIATSVSV